MKTKQGIILFIVILFPFVIFAQTKWTLDSCISHALNNNYSIKQSLIDLETKKLQLQTTKMSRLPSLSASLNQNFDFGRSETAGGIIVDNTQSTSAFSIGMNVPLFEGMKTYHQIASDKLYVKATTEDLNSTKEQIELTVTAYYLQLLLYKEMLGIAEEQVELSENQVERVESLLQAGKSSEAELYTSKANLANDEVGVAEARNNVRLATLDLAQLMNVTDAESFEIDDENIEIDMEKILARYIDKNAVIDNSLHKRSAIKAAELRIEKSQKDIKIARSTYYPSLQLSANYGTGYYYAFQQSLQTSNAPFGQQLSNNSREIIALNVSIPIFDRMSTANRVKQAKLTMRSQEIQLEEAKHSLIKEIEQAYTNAMLAKEKYIASDKAEKASEIAFQYEEKKYQAGASSIYVYNEAKINYQKAQSQVVQAKFDYFFRLKILDFYND
ncbi:MAG: TolC family protein [Bacteroidales bacterium]